MRRHRVVRRKGLAALLPTEAELFGQDYIDWRDGFLAGLIENVGESLGTTPEEIEAVTAQDNAAACEASLAEIQRQREQDRRKQQARQWIRQARGQC